jgi:hypothetical protein
LPIPDFIAGQVLTEAQLDSNFGDIAAALTQSLSKDGQTMSTSNQPMGGFKHTGVAAATARNEYATAGQIQDASLIYGGDVGGTATALTVTLQPPLTAYTAGQWLAGKAILASAGAATLNINGLGAMPIKRHQREIQSGDWLAGDILLLWFDGANFQLIAPNYVSLESGRNALINGNFDIWQRGASFAAAAAARYLADRWQDYSVGTTIAPARSGFSLGQGTVPGEPAYHHRSVVASVAGAGNLALFLQKIEGVRTFAGQTVTASWWARADAAKPVSVEFVQSFGAGGSPSAPVTGIGVTKVNLTAAWQKFTVTTAIPSIAGKTIGTDGNDHLEFHFWFDAGSNYNARTQSLGQQSGTFDIAQVQLEPGAVATPFERRPIGQELALCQRYYEMGTSIWSGDVTATGIYHLTVAYAVEKRATPAVTCNETSSSGFAAAGWTINYDGPATRQVRVYKTANATLAGGYYNFGWQAAAEL